MKNHKRNGTMKYNHYQKKKEIGRSGGHNSNNKSRENKRLLQKYLNKDTKKLHQKLLKRKKKKKAEKIII